MSSARKTLLVLLTVALVAVAAVAAAAQFHRTRPRVRRSLPERDYQFARYSQPLRTTSSPPTEIVTTAVEAANRASSVLDRKTTSTAEAAQRRVKSFQFATRPRLAADHCSISQMSVLLHESGHWTVSLRADQNPVAAEGAEVTTAQPSRRATDFLLRNQFFVSVRCFVAHGDGQSDRLLGKPFVIPLDVKPFWVQRQQPRQLFETGFHPHIQQYFNSIDRVEIEFAYRMD